MQYIRMNILNSNFNDFGNITLVDLFKIGITDANDRNTLFSYMKHMKKGLELRIPQSNQNMGNDDDSDTDEYYVSGITPDDSKFKISKRSVNTQSKQNNDDLKADMLETNEWDLNNHANGSSINNVDYNSDAESTDDNIEGNNNDNITDGNSVINIQANNYNDNNNSNNNDYSINNNNSNNNNIQIHDDIKRDIPNSNTVEYEQRKSVADKKFNDIYSSFKPSLIDFNKYQKKSNIYSNFTFSTLHNEPSVVSFNTVEELNNYTIPDKYCDPITNKLMNDPVELSDGYTYDRISIEKYIESHNLSPITQQILPHKILIPKPSLKNEIIKWKKTHEYH